MYKRGKSVRAFCMILTFIFTLNGMCSVALASEETGLKNLARGLSYEVSTPPRDVWEDTDNKELTDGVYGKKDFTDPAWQGHHRTDEPGGKRSFTFDLGEPKSIKRISANFLHYPGAAIAFPSEVIVAVSNDGETWYELSEIISKISLGYEHIAVQRFFWDGDQDGVPAQPVNINMVYAQYVRIEFIKNQGPWAFLDEVEIIGEDGKVSDDIWEVPIGDDAHNTADKEVLSLKESNTSLSHNGDANDGMTNLSQGLDYEIYIPDATSQPDYGKELTDGAYGEKDPQDSAWQVHNKDDGTERILEIDLGELKSIKQIGANFLHYPDSNIGFPDKVKIEVSTDGENWGELSEVLSKKSLDYEHPARQLYFWNGDEAGVPALSVDVNMVYAQYIRMTFPISSQLVLIDEVEVLGVDGKAEGAEPLPIVDPWDDIPADADYMRCGEQTANINNIALLYNQGNREWKKDSIIPYLGYVDQKGEIKDWFFESVLYLGLTAPGGRGFASNTSPANAQDWQWYLDRTFKESGDMQELDRAAREVAEKMGQPDRKIKVFLMIPWPATKQSKFGVIDDSGDTLNFNHEEIGKEAAVENRKKAVKWYIDNAIQLWNDNEYSNIELVGFYWLWETLEAEAPYESELIKYTGDLVHEEDLKYLWIPFYKANEFYNWKEFGFDMAVLQPNYFFNDYIKPTRLRDAAALAKTHGMGVELELDERVTSSDGEGAMFRDRYRQYLDYGVKYGYTGDVLKAYYQGGTALLECSKSSNKDIRSIYDDTYKFVRDKYPTDPEEPIEKEWVVAEDITIGGAANMQGPNIDGGIPGIYGDDAYILGKPGAKRRLEGFKLELEGAPSDMLVVYRGHVQGDTIRPNEKDDDLDTTWEDAEGQLWKKEGFFLGRKGEKRKFEGVELKLINKDTGKEYEDYKIQYQIHVHGEGWGDEWIEDGAFAGIESKNQRIEALRLRILKWQ